MNDKTPKQPATPEQPGNPDAASTAGQPEAVDTTVQPAVGEAAAAKKNRFAWVSSPKVAAATVITVLAFGGLGGAFALGRATAGHGQEHGDRVIVGIPGGFDGPGMGRHGGWGERGPVIERRLEPQEQQPDATPSPSASSSATG